MRTSLADAHTRAFVSRASASGAVQPKIFLPYVFLLPLIRTSACISLVNVANLLALKTQLSCVLDDLDRIGATVGWTCNPVEFLPPCWDSVASGFDFLPSCLYRFAPAFALLFAEEYWRRQARVEQRSPLVEVLRGWLHREGREGAGALQSALLEERAECIRHTFVWRLNAVQDHQFVDWMRVWLCAAAAC